MAALSPQFMAILKKVLASRFVPLLPPLLGAAPPADQISKQLSRAFSAFVLHKLLDLTPQVAAAAVVDDIQDKGLDAIYYDEKSETLFLLQTKLKGSEQFRQDDALPFCEGVHLLLQGDFRAFNANVHRRQVEIENALGECTRIKLVVPYTGDGVSVTAMEALQNFLDDEVQDEERLVTTVQFYTADDVTRDLLAEQAYRAVNAEIALYKHQKIEQPRVTYFGVAHLADLVKLHRTHGKALYEKNIRYFLGSTKSDVNKAIKSTLHDNPENFFYLNNGVTAICEVIEPKGRGAVSGARKFKLRGLSIINGAQTVASAAEFARQYPAKCIDDAKVMLTLIRATSDGEFGRKVTKARNHQNPVQTANFASLDENQERLRQEIAHLDFDYHYRPEAAISTGANVIALDEALRALALLQNDPRFAVWLKSDLARLSNPESAEYQTIFSPQLTATVLVNVVLCYRAIHAILLENEQNAQARSQEKLIYRHGSLVIAATMIKRLRTRIVGNASIVPGTISPLISLTLDHLRQEVFDLARPHLILEGPLAFFRNQGNVSSFLPAVMERHYALAADPVVVQLRNVSSALDRYPKQRLIDYLASRAPQL